MSNNLYDNQLKIVMFSFKYKILFTFISIINVSPVFTQNFAEVANVKGVDLAGQKDGGHVWVDFNNDGYLDLIANTGRDGFFGSGTRVYFSNADPNSDNITLTDVTVTHAQGLIAGGDPTHRAVVCGDFNNDGYIDIACNGNTRLDIYLNQGIDGIPNYSFGDAVNQEANYSYNAGDGVIGGMNVEGMAWADVDSDGWLDLIIDNHGNGTEILTKQTSSNPCNTGFDYSDGSVIGLINGNVTGDYLTVGDINSDGFVDILVRKEDAGESLYINNGDGTFTLNPNIIEQANNGNKGGAIMCDFDNDGDLDIFWSDAGSNVIYENLGGNPITFNIHSEGTIVGGFSGINPTEIIDGCACGDIDLDGDIDLFLSGNGGTSYLYKNDLSNGNVFDFIQDNGGINVNANGESCSLVDFDNDGDLDIYVQIHNNTNQLWRSDLITNTSPSSDLDFLRVKVLMQEPYQIYNNPLGRDYIGAQVFVRRTVTDGGGLIGMREVNGGRGHGSQDPMTLHFGLPDGADIDYEIEVKFPNVNGITRTITEVVTPSNFNNHLVIFAIAAEDFSASACNDVVALPIELISFEGKTESNYVRLDWKTLTEKNNSHFTIFRSSDAKTFEEITTIDGNGDSNIPIEYTFLDKNPINGINYYYLKQYDFDGRESSSRIVNINVSNSTFKLYPNPTKTRVYLEHGKNEIQEINIFSNRGKFIKKMQLNKNDTDVLELDLGSLDSGLYIVKIQTKYTIITQKLIIE